MKLLFAEDEAALSEAVCDVLTFHSYIVDAVGDGADALAYARAGDYDAIVLDIMMPKKSGIEVLEALRREGNTTPILLLTAKAEIDDRIAGLNAGADDYLTKPFAMGELLARIRAMLRRREVFTPDELRCGDLTLHMQTFELSAGGITFTLPKQEYRLMEQLMINQGIYLSTEELLTRAWGFNAENDVGSVWLYVSYLRKRLSAMGSNVIIRLKRGVGYRLEVEK